MTHATPGTPKERPATIWRSVMLVAVLAANTFLGALNGQIFAPILPELAADLGVTEAAVGQLVTASAVAGIFLSLVAGPLSDRYGRRPILLAGVATLAVSSLATAVAPSYGVLVAVRLGSGVGAALVFPTALASAADFLPLRWRAPAIGWLIGASGVAVVVGWPVVALAVGALGWRPLFLGLGGLLVALMALLRLVIPPPGNRSTPGSAIAAGLDRYRAALGDRSVQLAVAASGLGAATWFGFSTYLGAYFVEVHDRQTPEQAPIFAALGVGYFLASVSGGMLAAHLGSRTVAILSGAGSALVLLALAGVPAQLAVAIGLTVAVGVLRGGGLTAMSSLVVSLRPGERGTVAGLNSAVFSVGIALGAGLGGAALTVGGFTLLYASLAILAFGSAALLLGVRR